MKQHVRSSIQNQNRSLLQTLNGSGRSIYSIATILMVALLIAACGGDATMPDAESSTTGDSQELAVQAEDASEADESEADAELESEARTVGDVISDSDESDDATSEMAEPALPTFDPASTQIAMEPMIDGLTRPVYVTSANDGSGRLFIVEQPGVIRIYSEGALLPDPFLDIETQVGDQGNEQGLLGLAFAPNFAETGHAFVNYTGLDGTTNVSRFTLMEGNPDQLDPSSEFTVLTIPQPAQNHNGGMVTFGPDGYLYVGTGDGGAANDRFGNGQNPAALLGKMLRIDVTTDPSQPYLIPEDNPWIAADWTVNGEAADVLDEIWAIGLRNPWRYSFDRATGDLWIADVGQNKLEEVNFVAASTLDSEAQGGTIQAMNFGWPIMEANECFSVTGGCDSDGLVMPVAEYDHSGHCSVTGGYVYRGEQFPALQGVYLYADYCSGVVWAMVPDGNGGWTNSEVLQSGLTISSFGEDEQGELYITSFDGMVHQVTVEN